VLQSKHIVMDRDSGTVDIPGPGQMSIARGTAGQDAAGPTTAAEPITVSWQDSMHYDDQTSQVRFVGQAKVERHARLEDVELSSGELVLNLLSGNDDEPAIRTATARDDVVFSAQRRTSEADDKIATRLHLTGPTVNFDGVLEQMQVVGAGTLLVEDYADSEPAEEKTRSEVADGLQAAVAMGGQGATLFTWTGDFLLDVRHNDMRMTDRVQMDHRPQGSDQTVHVDCRQLLADLEETGGLGALMSGRPMQPRVIAIYARDAVRIVDRQRTILADHMQYTAVDQQVLLRGDPSGIGTVMVNEEGGSTLSAEQVRWNLTQDEIEILKPGPTRAPLTEFQAVPVQVQPNEPSPQPAVVETQPEEQPEARRPRRRLGPRRR